MNRMLDSVKYEDPLLLHPFTPKHNFQKGIIMEDPCKKCLVKVTCAHICPDKKNYGVFLNDSLLRYRGVEPRYLNTPTYKILQEKHFEHLVSKLIIRKRFNKIKT
jgi:hypothetical protein